MTPAHALTEDEQIEAALAILDQAQPIPPAPAAASAAPLLPELPESPTLAGLDANRRPKLRTVCEVCPNSVWFASPAEVKCYCCLLYTSRCVYETAPAHRHQHDSPDTLHDPRHVQGPQDAG